MGAANAPSGASASSSGAQGGSSPGVALPAIEEFRGAVASAATVARTGAEKRQIDQQTEIGKASEVESKARARLIDTQQQRATWETSSARFQAEVDKASARQAKMYEDWLKSNVGSKMFNWDKFWSAFNPFTTSAKAFR